jgi:hypothetical protein
MHYHSHSNCPPKNRKTKNPRIDKSALNQINDVSAIDIIPISKQRLICCLIKDQGNIPYSFQIIVVLETSGLPEGMRRHKYVPLSFGWCKKIKQTDYLTVEDLGSGQNPLSKAAIAIVLNQMKKEICCDQFIFPELKQLFCDVIEKIPSQFPFEQFEVSQTPGTYPEVEQMAS